jgi:hypothetical protein
MDRGARDEVLGRLAEAVGSVTVAHPTRVAIDGPPAAGKTTLADELAVVLRAQGRDVIRATIDDFLFPRAQRYPRGEYSAEGCYFDTHDYDALNRVLLDPLGPGKNRRFQYAVYDRTADTVLSPPVTTAPADAVLVRREGADPRLGSSSWPLACRFWAHRLGRAAAGQRARTAAEPDFHRAPDEGAGPRRDHAVTATQVTRRRSRLKAASNRSSLIVDLVNVDLHYILRPPVRVVPITGHLCSAGWASSGWRSASSPSSPPRFCRSAC